jgi:sec-independent protein translocase protein TatA
VEFLNIGAGELLLILVVALIIFGPAKLPEMGKTIGKGIREFRRATSEVTQEFKSSLDLETESPRPAIQRYLTCAGCGMANPQTSAYCGRCGAALVTAAPRTCGNCGAQNEASNAFCGQCGARIVVSSEPVAQWAPPVTVAPDRDALALANGQTEPRAVTAEPQETPSPKEESPA